MIKHPDVPMDNFQVTFAIFINSHFDSRILTIIVMISNIYQVYLKEHDLTTFVSADSVDDSEA